MFYITICNNIVYIYIYIYILTEFQHFHKLTKRRLFIEKIEPENQIK